MADFAALIKKTIDTLAEPTPFMRQRVYQRARQTVSRKLTAANVPKNVADKQLEALEEAINEVEKSYLLVEQQLLGILPETAEEHETAAANSAAFAANDQQREDKQTENKPAQAGTRPPQAESSSIALDTSHEDNVVQARETLTGATKIESLGAAENSRPRFDRFTVEKKDDASRSNNVDPALNEANVRFAPDAESVNLSSSSLVSPREERGKEEDSRNNQSSNEFDLVSDIFVQAAKRGERQAARRKLIMVSVISCVILIFIIVVAGVTWKLLGTNKSRLEKAQVTPATSNNQPPQKLTYRLLADGSETNPGPAPASSKSGGGTSAVEQRGGTNANLPAEAVYYEARTETETENVERGRVTWTLVREPSATGGAEQSAIRGDVTIPQKNISLRLTIRRNTDPTIPAAYLVEVIYILPDNFAGGAIDKLREFTFKASEQSIGQPLNGVTAAKIGDNFFIYALSSLRPFVDGNLRLMKQLNWIRLVAQYKTGRVSELTFSKGAQGVEVFDKVFDEWLNEQDKSPNTGGNSAP